jgi:hypothetical protein
MPASNAANNRKSSAPLPSTPPRKTRSNLCGKVIYDLTDYRVGLWLFPILPLILVEFLKVLEGSHAAWAEYVSKDTVVANQCEYLDVLVVERFFWVFFGCCCWYPN